MRSDGDDQCRSNYFELEPCSMGAGWTPFQPPRQTGDVTRTDIVFGGWNGVDLAEAALLAWRQQVGTAPAFTWRVMALAASKRQI
jgi:hypothetical protein